MHAIEARQDRLRLPEPERPQENRRRKALLSVDANLQKAPGIGFEFEPGTPIGHYLSQKTSALRLMEENAG